MSRRSFVGLFLIFCFAYSNASLQCKDENGEDVDWFVMYKINKDSSSSDPLIKTGAAYNYITSATVATGWQFSTKGVAVDAAILTNTLLPLYKGTSTPKAIVMYNDQPPGAADVGTLGHAKGVVMTNGNEGFWLIHSVPNFPKKPAPGVKYGYPRTGAKYAQSFLCISVNANQIETIAHQLYINQVVPYYSKVTNTLKQKFPTLSGLVDGSYNKGKPDHSKATIQSIAGLEFTSFAKSNTWLKELYHDYVAPELNSPMIVQTWRSGQANLNSDCTGKAVYNVKYILMPVSISSSQKMKHTVDHSKWAISETSGPNGNWVCIGDINRMSTQKERGGGTVCVRLPQLWQSYKNIVNQKEGCR